MRYRIWQLLNFSISLHSLSHISAFAIGPWGRRIASSLDPSLRASPSAWPRVDCLSGGRNKMWDTQIHGWLACSWLPRLPFVWEFAPAICLESAAALLWPQNCKLQTANCICRAHLAVNARSLSEAISFSTAAALCFFHFSISPLPCPFFFSPCPIDMDHRLLTIDPRL